MNLIEDGDTKACPYCAEIIKAAAIKCRYCQSDLSDWPGPLPLQTGRRHSSAVDQDFTLQPRDWWTYVALHLPGTVPELAVLASAEETTMAGHVDTLVHSGLVKAEGRADGSDQVTYVCSRQVPRVEPVSSLSLTEHYADLEPLDWWLYVLLDGPLTGADLDERTGLDASISTRHISRLSRAKLVEGQHFPGKYAYRRSQQFDAETMDNVVGHARRYPFANMSTAPAQRRYIAQPLPTTLADLDPVTLWFYLAVEEPSSTTELAQLSGLDDDATMANLAQLMAAGVIHYSLVPGVSQGLDFYRTHTFDPSTMAAIEARVRRAGYPTPRARREYLTAATPAQRTETPVDPAAASPKGTPVPVAAWRGITHMTHAEWVAVRCDSCRHHYTIEGAVANTLADQQSLAKRGMRWATKVEQFGATFTVGASGRRIAAGNESQRQQQQLGITLGLIACPQCSRTEVTLFKA